MPFIQLIRPNTCDSSYLMYFFLFYTTSNLSVTAFKLQLNYSQVNHFSSSPLPWSISYLATTVSPDWFSCSTLGPLGLFSTKQPEISLIYKLDHMPLKKKNKRSYGFPSVFTMVFGEYLKVVLTSQHLSPLPKFLFLLITSYL